MSIGDGREGKIRAALAKGQLGGKLSGLSLPRQIVTIALWPLLEQVMSGALPNERQALLAALAQTAQKPPAKGGPQG